MDFNDQQEVKRLVEGCVKKNADCQKILYKAMYGPMMAVCYRYARRPEDAKDLFQEGFIKVFNKIEKYNFKGSLQGWIRRIMINHAIDHYRKQKDKYSMSESMLEAERIPEEEVETSLIGDMTAKQLLQFVQQLSPVYKQVFNMYVLDGYTHGEISEILGISEGTSKSNLSKAKSNLKKMILNQLTNT
jgi:RNA polymerase sigma-70 factor (ECF subfamily)